MLNRVNRVLVTNTTGANTGTNIATIINGDILIFNKTFTTALTGTPTPISAEGNDTIYIAQGIGTGKMITSFPIVLRNVTKVTVRGYVAPAEKVLTFGYNGTSGTIAAPEDNTEYALNINILDDQRIEGNRPTRQYYSYVSDASATAKELAFAFAAKVGNDNFPANTNSYVSAAVLTDGTFTALTNNATVTQYGKAVASTAHGLSAGDYVRIGGTAATVPVYKVATVVDANTFTIEGRYAGASGTVLAANIGAITADTVVGLQLTGKAIAFNGIDLYQKNNFIASLYATNTTGFNVLSTPVETTALSYGQGYWQQVRDAEYFAQGYMGVTNRTQFPGSVNGQPATRAVVDNTYNSVVIEHYGEEETSLQRQEKYPLTTEIYFYASSAPTASTKQTNFLGTLETLVEAFGVRVQ
jgi:hypothetical protein